MIIVISNETVEKLKTVSCATAWAMQGGGNTFLMEDVFPLDPDYKCIGPALTINFKLISLVNFEKMRRNPKPPRRNVMSEAWEKLQPGQVVVIGGTSGAACVLGDCITTGYKAKGAAGIVTDGLVRDTPMIKSLEIPVFTLNGKGTTGYIPPLKNRYVGIPDDVNVPITCAGVNVNPGDFVLGDNDGVVIIPIEKVDEIAEASYAEEQLEKLSRKLLLEGKPLSESYPPRLLKKDYIEKAGLLKYWEIIEKRRKKLKKQKTPV